jgi:hypothetical protein
VGFCSIGYQSWEYTGDTLILGQNSKKVNVVAKYATAWDTSVYLNPYYTTEYFKVSGDTVSIFNSADTSWQELYNFSLQIGDTTMSPLNNILNGAALSCTDSIPYKCPAIVVDTGHVVISGQSLRYYTVEYVNLTWMDTTYAQQTYYERLITLNYWYPSDFYSCHSTDACATPWFVCYKDDGMITDSLCTNVSWIENLSLDEPQQSTQLTIYPNPTTSVLTIKNDDNPMEKYSIIGSDGKLVLTNIQSPINTINLTPGVYFITNEGRTWYKKFVKS